MAKTKDNNKQYQYGNYNVAKTSTLKKFNAVIKNTDTENYLKRVLGEQRKTFVLNLTSLVGNNKSLQKCDPLSLIYAGIKATAIGLPLDNDLGKAYVIPYHDKYTGLYLAQFQVGYKGFIDLAQRTNKYKFINASEVKEGELVGFNILTGEHTFNTADLGVRDELKTVGYVAYIELHNGFRKSFYMTAKQVENYAKKYSESYKSDRNGTSPWAVNRTEMAKKTTLKKLLKVYAPIELELAEALRADQAVIDKNGNPIYVDNKQPQVDDVVAEEIESKANTEVIDMNAHMEEKEQQEEEQVKAPQEEEEVNPGF